MRRIASGLTAGFLLGVCALAWGASASSGATAHAPARAAAVTESEAAAQTRASFLLTQLRLPDGSTPSPLEPVGDGDQLAAGAYAPDTPNLVDEHQWWMLDGARHGALEYLLEHPPAGARDAGQGLSGPSEFVTFEWPEALGGGSLVVELVQLPDEQTGLRVDAQVVWQTPRTALPIPSGAHILWITTKVRLNRSEHAPKAARVTSSSRIAAIAGLLDALPAVQPGSRGCPIERGQSTRFAFYSRRDTPPLAVAVLDDEGCGGVGLSVEGNIQQSLEGSVEVRNRAERILHVRLAPRP